MFWGLILKSNKKYTQTLEKSFHLSQASLDHSSSDNEPVQVMYSHDDNSYLLCTLQKGKVYQCQLDLNFQEGDKLCFSTKGNGIVHLTGYLTEDEFDQFGDMDDEEEESEQEVEDLRQKLESKKKQGKEQLQSKKKPGKEQVATLVDSDDAADDSDDEADNSDDEMNETAEQESGEEEESGDDDDDDDDEDDSDVEEETPAPPAKQQKLDPKAQLNGKKQKNGVNGTQPEPKQKEKGVEGKILKLQGGLTIQDLKIGHGAEAKPGKKIQVYYVGRLKSNNKVFDSTKEGPGFKLTVGRGEVIKAWDLGLSGMKVGGKRRLVCPPNLAYGAKGNPPVIPANSTLVFDVELKNVL